MRKLSLAVGLLLVLSAGLVQVLPWGSTAQAATTDVSVQDNFFNQANITITAGDTVHWTWAGAAAHSVTADDGSFDSNPVIPPGAQVTGTFDHTFTTPGTYAYHCRIHGAAGGIGMSGVITVQAAAPTATNTAAQATSTSTPASTATATAVGTSTSTATAGATQTVAATSTRAPQPTVGVAATATPRIAAAAAGASLPKTGTGNAASGGWPRGWVALAFAAAGAVVLATGLLWRRRA